MTNFGGALEGRVCHQAQIRAPDMWTAQRVAGYSRPVKLARKTTQPNKVGIKTSSVTRTGKNQRCLKKKESGSSSERCFLKKEWGSISSFSSLLVDDVVDDDEGNRSDVSDVVAIVISINTCYPLYSVIGYVVWAMT